MSRCGGIPSITSGTMKGPHVTDDPSDRRPPNGIDETVPHSARIWNHWLGGKDNYPVDRKAGDQYAAIYPAIVDLARAQRHFLARAVRYLAGEAGIRQFLDVGTGLPTVDNTHEIAQRVAPDACIVYVDNDPLVLVHARALLTSSRQGVTDYVEADVREPEKILEAAAEILDFSRPVALMMLGILAHIDPYDEARSIVRRLMAGLPSGSYLTIADGADTDGAFVEAQRGYNESGAIPYHLRSPEQIAGYFEGLELVEPGLVQPPQWRLETAPVGPPLEVSEVCAVGRKR
jgi:hypothetical protein